MSATLYRADGSREEIEAENGRDFTAAEIYKLLGCDMLEVINTGDPNMIFIGDEEARLSDEYVINVEATRIYRDSLGITDPHAAKAAELAEMAKHYSFVIDVSMDDEPYSIAGDVIYCPSVMLL